MKTNRAKGKPRLQGDNRLKLLVEAVDSIRDYGIFVLDPDGYVLTWNKGAERIKGYQADEIIGQHFTKFYTKPDLDRNHPQNELKEAKKTGRYEDEGWRVRKDGTLFWANVVITKLTDKEGNLIGFSKVTRDLSARKSMEEQLRESEERFRLLIGGVKDYAIFMLDPKGLVMSWNEGAARIKGYDAKEIIGKYFSIFYPEEDVRAGKCEYELEEASITGRFEDEGWRVRKDGTKLWANVVITAIRDKNRKLLGFSKVTRDLTEKKRAEDRLQRAHAELENRVRERTAELARANSDLEKRELELRQAIKVRDEFLSIASHELKTPITSLKMQIQMLQQKFRPEADQPVPRERLQNFMDVSVRQINRLTQLVGDLLDVARAQARKLTFNFERLDLRTVVTEVVDRLRDQLEAAGCPLEIRASRPVMGNFDRFRMDQVIVNLLTNAIKYAPGGKVQISLETENNAAVLTVTDQGPGIAGQCKLKLFQRFERGANANNIAGLGLGLFITKQIVDGHHGSIELVSEPGHGASFRIELPLNLLSVSTREVGER